MDNSILVVDTAMAAALLETVDWTSDYWDSGLMMNEGDDADADL